MSEATLGVSATIRTLDTIAPGCAVVFADFAAELDAAFREQLLAYGLHPGQRLEVLHQLPMTVILCDHAELALEAPVAKMIGVCVPAGS